MDPAGPPPQTTASTWSGNEAVRNGRSVLTWASLMMIAPSFAGALRTVAAPPIPFSETDAHIERAIISLITSFVLPAVDAYFRTPGTLEAGRHARSDAGCSIESSLGQFTMSYGGIGDRPSAIRTANLEAAQQSWQIKTTREQA